MDGHSILEWHSNRVIIRRLHFFNETLDEQSGGDGPSQVGADPQLVASRVYSSNSLEKPVSEVVWQRWVRNDGIGWSSCVVNNKQVRKSSP